MKTYNIDVNLKFSVPAHSREEAFGCLCDGFRSGKYIPEEGECRFNEYGSGNKRKRLSEEARILRNLADEVIRYDKMTDKFICLLERGLKRNGVDYESMRGYDRIHMMRDDRFCKVREILRIVKNDPHLLYC